MKKFIISILVFVNIVLTVHAESMLDMLRGKRAELSAQGKLLEAKSKELGGVYNQLNTQLLGEINKTINSTLNNYINAINASKDSVSGIPPLALKFVGIGDIGTTLDSIKNVLDATRSELEKIRDRFKPIIADLSPTDDLKGVFKGFSSALENLNKTDSAMNSVEEFLKQLESDESESEE